MLWHDPRNRPMTPSEIARYDQISARVRDLEANFHPTLSQRWDMAIATAGGFLAACFSAPWWFYVGCAAAGYFGTKAIVWMVKQ